MSGPQPRDPPSIKKQKNMVERVANEPLPRSRTVTTSAPRTSFAYKTALVETPHGKAHHTFKITPNTGASSVWAISSPLAWHRLLIIIWGILRGRHRAPEPEDRLRAQRSGRQQG